MTHEFEPTSQLTNQKFVVARHAEYDSEDRLSALGVTQSEKLALKIGGFFGERLLAPGMVIVLTAISDRAQETGKIISDVLKIPQPLSYLSLGNKEGKAYMYESMFRDIRHFIDPIGGYKGIIIVTHKDQTAYLPLSLLGQTRYSNELSPCDRGAAWGVDTQAVKEGKKLSKKWQRTPDGLVFMSAWYPGSKE